jgi:hypothetical protein
VSEFSKPYLISKDATYEAGASTYIQFIYDFGRHLNDMTSLPTSFMMHMNCQGEFQAL